MNVVLLRASHEQDGAMDMMDTRSVVENYFDAMSDGHFEKMGKYLSADSAYWLAGEGSWRFGGWHDAQSVQEMVANIMNRFPQGIKIAVDRIIVQHDSAAVFLVSSGTRKDGLEYRNDVVIMVTVKDGLITEQREYLDTIKARRFLDDPMS